jgi:NAD(P)-dependent dehydrogenase (short-subunit alcohol dehydrogenase family)
VGRHRRHADRGGATRDAVRAAGGSAAFVKTDVTQEADCARLTQAAVEHYGKLDVVICCAGILQGAMLHAEALDPATFERVLSVNTKGTFLTVRAALPHLRKAESRRFWCSPRSGTDPSMAYGASKAWSPPALKRNLHLRHPRQRDCPSSIATPMRIENLVDRARAAGRDPEQARAEAVKEAGDPAGVARLLAFLASVDADYVRGALCTR